MNFSQNYLDFFDIQVVGRDKFEKTKEDFVFNLWEFLNHIMEWQFRTKNNKIAENLFNLMIAPDLHYHTPVHILSIFQQAELMNLKLDISEKLAIWFHDAVYIVGSVKNEINSALFMESLLSDSINSEIINSSKDIILATSNHCLDITCGNQVLDLDLFSLGGSRELYQSTTRCVRKEYSDKSDEQFFIGRKVFMSKLIEKGYIYRTNSFKIFEKQAFENLEIKQFDQI